MEYLKSQSESNDRLRVLLLEEDWDSAQPKAEKIISEIGVHATPILIDLLSSSRADVQSRAAWYLRSIRDNRAVPALVKAINENRRTGRIGSFVWALQQLNCEEHLLLMVDLALHGGYEVRSHALRILEHQQFRAASEEVAKARAMLDEFVSNSESKDSDSHFADAIAHAIATSSPT